MSSTISRGGIALITTLLNRVIFRMITFAVFTMTGKEKILSSRTIQNAVRSIIPGELAKHAVSEGTKVITKKNSRPY